jgi:hypothetical protein
MAIIQIPVGGQAVGIEVPDFAMESTLRELVNEVRQQTGALSAGLSSIAAKSSGSSSTQNNEQNGIMSGLAQIIRDKVPGGSAMITAAAASRDLVNNVAQSGKLSESIQNGLLTSIPFLSDSLKQKIDSLSGPLSSVVGIIEQMSQSLNNLVRVGVSASVSLIDLKTSAATLGLELPVFSQLVAASGKTIAALGGNTTQGTKRLLEMISTVRTVTQDVGYLGMTSGELAQFMVDELEIRRSLNNTLELQQMDARRLSEALKEQYVNQSAVARLTGQDVQDRLRAGQDYRRQVSSAGVLATLNEDAQRAAVDAASSFTQFGATLGPIIEDMYNRQMAFGSAFAGMDQDTAGQMSVAIGVLQQQGIDFVSYLQQLDSATRSGDTDLVNQLSLTMSSAIKNLSGTQTAELAGAFAQLGIGDLLGRAIMESTAGDASQLGATRQQIQQEISTGELAFQGIQTTYEEARAGMIALRDNAIMQLVGVNANTEDEMRAISATVMEGITMLSTTGNTFLSGIAAAQSETMEALQQLGIDLGGLPGLITNLNGAVATLNDTQQQLQATMSGMRAENRN